MERTSEAWSKDHNGGIFELHCYSVPDNIDDNVIKINLLRELFHYLPELNGIAIIHEYYQCRDDFPSFYTGQHLQRPGTGTDIPNLFLAGDWVKIPSPAMLMEAAYTSGAIAANGILSANGLRENLLESVPDHGLLT
jgi:isorenieratene synthase